MIKFLPLFIFAFFASPLAADQLSSQSLSINIGPIEQLYSYYDEGDESDCEGQESCHKRDGFAFQLWGALPVTKRLNVRFGIGPYLCFDTVFPTGQDFQQTRSIVPMYSLATSYDFKLFGHPSFAQLTLNKTGTRDGFSSTSYLLGLGAYFAPAQKYITRQRTPFRQVKLPFLRV